MENKLESLSYILREFTSVIGLLGLGIGLGAFSYLVVSLSSTSTEYESRQNPVVSRKEIPETIEKKLWFGGKKEESIILKMDGDYYHKLINTPRNARSQIDYPKFAKTNSILEEIANHLMEADESNFNNFMIHPVRDDSGLVRYYSESHIFGKDYMRVLDFVNTNIEYKKDLDLGYAQFPLETLIKGIGDCEDMAYLTAALLNGRRNIGIVYETQKDKGHITLAIELNSNETLPTAMIINEDEHFETALEMIESGELDEKDSFVEGYKKVLTEHPELVKRIEVPIVIFHDGREYFLIETTGNAYDIRTEIGEFEFYPLTGN